MANKKKKPPRKPIAFRIPENLLERLDAVAEKNMVSRNQMLLVTLDKELPKRVQKEKDDAQPSFFD